VIVYAQLVIICLYVAMLATGIWLVRLVRELIAIIRKVDTTLMVTESRRQPIVPDPPGALCRERQR